MHNVILGLWLGVASSWALCATIIAILFIRCEQLVSASRERTQRLYKKAEGEVRQAAWDAGYKKRVDEEKWKKRQDRIGAQAIADGAKFEAAPNA